MLVNLLRNRPGPEVFLRSWGLVAFFVVLVMLHFALLAISPLEVEMVQPSTTGGGASTASHENSPTSIGDTGKFKEFLNGFSMSTESSSKENEGMAEEAKERPHRMHPEDSKEEYAAICMAVKDQHLDLPEFLIHHYHHLGIRRFYIMDDGSDPPLSTFKDYGIPREHLTFHYWNRTTDHVPDMQDHIYDACMTLYRDKHVWMAFIDADEMLEMTGEETLTEMLKRLEKDRSVGALGVSWKTHSSNRLLTRPASMRKAFTDCIWDGYGHNFMWKSIVKTEFHAGHYSVHQAHLAGNTLTVDEDGIPITGQFRDPPTKKRIALHHYALKSKQEYQEKIDRSNAMDAPKGWSFWDQVESQAGIPCDEMAYYEP